MARMAIRPKCGGRRRALVCCVAVAVLCAVRSPARAQEPSGPQQGEWRFVASPLAGWHFFGPVRASVTAVVGAGTSDLMIPGMRSRFLLLMAEPGLRGGRLSLGAAQFIGWSGGLIARGTVLRFWGGAPHRTYYGAELQWIVSILPIGVRVGAFRPARDEGDGRDILWMADFSVNY
jgi:hypothetical protein